MVTSKVDSHQNGLQLHDEVADKISMNKTALDIFTGAEQELQADVTLLMSSRSTGFFGLSVWFNRTGEAASNGCSHK